MRFFFFLFALFFISFPACSKDKSIEPNLIYDELLDAGNYKIEPYNYPAGTRELNLFGLKNYGQYNINAVAAPDFEYLIYSEVYFYPDSRVTASALYLIQLENNLSKKEAILAVSTKDKQQIPIIETNYSKLYPFKFNTFTPIDWNKKSNKILFKEKLGQNYYENYLTKLYLYDMTTESLYDLNLIRTQIVQYWAEKDLYLSDYKWDIKPLGFLKTDEDTILVEAYGFHKDEKKFLGLWGIDYMGKNAYLISLDKNFKIEIAMNGQCLKFIPDLRDIHKKQREKDAKEFQIYIEPK